MMSNPVSCPDQGFQDRINRLAEIRAPYEASRPKVDLLPDWKRDVAEKSGFIIAVLLGAFSLLLVRVWSFHVTGTAMISDTPDETMFNEVVVATGLSVILLLLTRYRKLYLVPLTLVGVMASAVFMHNAVHSSPDLFSVTFSPEWTAKVTTETEPHSIYFRGEVIPLKPEEEKPMPTILRGGMNG